MTSKKPTRAGRLRQKIHALIFPGQRGGHLQELFDAFIALCVLLSVVAVIMESVQSVDYILNIQFVILDAVMVAIFTIEYVMRLYCCVEEPGFKGMITGRFKQATTGFDLYRFSGDTAASFWKVSCTMFLI
jgi:hypothetical protein